MVVQTKQDISRLGLGNFEGQTNLQTKLIEKGIRLIDNVNKCQKITVAVLLRASKKKKFS